MGKVEQLQEQIDKISTEDLAKFRAWFAQFDADKWDREFEADARAGKLDELAEHALRAHAAGRSTEF